MFLLNVDGSNCLCTHTASVWFVWAPRKSCSRTIDDEILARPVKETDLLLLGSAHPVPGQDCFRWWQSMAWRASNLLVQACTRLPPNGRYKTFQVHIPCKYSDSDPVYCRYITFQVKLVYPWYIHGICMVYIMVIQHQVLMMSGAVCDMQPSSMWKEVIGKVGRAAEMQRD